MVRSGQLRSRPLVSGNRVTHPPAVPELLIVASTCAGLCFTRREILSRAHGQHMARRRKTKSPRILLLGLLLLASAILWLAVHPEVRETAKERWQEARDAWKRDAGSPEPESRSKAPEVAPAPAPQTTAWLLGRYSNSATYAGAPSAAGYPNSVTILTNAAYVVGYDETTRNPAWAAYRVSARRLNESFPRPGRFEVDPRSVSRVGHDDYTRSGFDRGHMVPNHAIASRFGATAQRETFLMTNVAPQAPALNQGPWRLMEEAIADRAAVAFEEVWVVVGPIYHEPAKTLPSGVRIPDAFYCVVVDELPTGPRMQAFVMSQDTPRQVNFRDFITTVDDVERVSGWDFFWELPDLLENAVEAQRPQYWLE